MWAGVLAAVAVLIGGPSEAETAKLQPVWGESVSLGRSLGGEDCEGFAGQEVQLKLSLVERVVHAGEVCHGANDGGRENDPIIGYFDSPFEIGNGCVGADLLRRLCLLQMQMRMLR